MVKGWLFPSDLQYARECEALGHKAMPSRAPPSSGGVRSPAPPFANSNVIVNYALCRAHSLVSCELSIHCQWEQRVWFDPCIALLVSVHHTFILARNVLTLFVFTPNTHDYRLSRGSGLVSTLDLLTQVNRRSPLACDGNYCTLHTFTRARVELVCMWR
jgi:hypothetical protein